MKNVVLIVLSLAITLSAVQWDVEQVTNEPNTINSKPQLAVAQDGDVRILFSRNTLFMQDDLIVASNSSGQWVFLNVASDIVDEYSVDVNADGVTHVVYVLFTLPDNTTEVFLANDDTGIFVSEQVTDSPENEFEPLMMLDNEGLPHIFYIKDTSIYYTKPEENDWLTLLVTDSLSSMGEYAMDFDASDSPYLTYTGYEDFLCFASPICGGEGITGWLTDTVISVASEHPSLVVDNVGVNHIAYRSTEYPGLRYNNNQTGVWVDEMIAAEGSLWDGLPDIELDSRNNIHVVWFAAHYTHAEIYYATRSTGEWKYEPVAVTQESIQFNWGRYFEIDDDGYGHLVYIAEDSIGETQVYYAKSTEPLTSGIGEYPPETAPAVLEVKGSTIHFTLGQASQVALNLYDAVGRQVERLASGNYRAGEHVVDIDVKDYPAGVYFVQGEISRQAVGVRILVY